MFTLPLRTTDVPNLPHIWSGFARVAAVIATVIDVYVEAEQQAIAAQKAYPFAVW